MAPPRPPPPLIDDVTAEIFVRLPPDEPQHLFRAALVCKPWLRVLCDPDFGRQYRAFHGAPPLLGLLQRREIAQGNRALRFASTTSMPAFPYPSSDGSHMRPLDCRHGRVLIHMLKGRDVDLLVWDPVTGDHRRLRQPCIHWMTYGAGCAAVFCAAEGCDHLDCHGGPFRVVLVGTDNDLDKLWAIVYSSETGAWSTPTSIYSGRAGYVDTWRGAVVGDEIYFILSRSPMIVKYD
ncbi:uncharacterized protein LOC120661187 isoform X1 [Panicum virgatum]|uniref:uncharacterized protein LOC120661187 isoform X1 n=1 Tax=Panicum virgatum TaxID=38727 RepID=UPI0019D566ED|nr:uncharacterized protein LOC120661187 isoform X1 [Panicum virgatum]